MSGTHTKHSSTIEKVGPSVIPRSERFRIRSPVSAETYVVDIARPISTTVPKALTPVIYVLDGNTLFGLTCQVVRLLEIGPKEIPPAVVVGISYETNCFPEGQIRRRALRLRDFTPTEDNDYWRRKFSDAEPLTYPPTIRTGGANSFRRFIREELQPFINSELQVESVDQTLVGMSLGGLFALHTLFTDPTMFSRWIAISPAIWWDGCTLLKTDGAVGNQMTDTPARLFISEGGDEDEDTRLNIRTLVTRLQNTRYSSLELTHHQFPDETHQSVFPGAVSRGLRTVFKRADLV